jgi:hypothetical protein
VSASTLNGRLQVRSEAHPAKDLTSRVSLQFVTLGRIFVPRNSIQREFVLGKAYLPTGIVCATQ